MPGGDSLSIEWFGCATFRVRVSGLTLWFDTYLDKAPGVPPVSLGAAEVDEADYLFISHAHFDHLAGADQIARRTGATVVGNYETARVMGDNDVPGRQILATAGGDTVDCGHGVTVKAFPSQHSCLYAASAPDAATECLGDLGVSAQDRRDRVAGIFDLLATTSGEAGAYLSEVASTTSLRDGGQLAYLLESEEGSLFVNASSGYWRGIVSELRPDVAILAANGQANVDGEPYQGSLADFVLDQVDLLGDPVTILCHHDPLFPPLVGAIDVAELEGRLRDRLGDDYVALMYETPTPLLRR